MPALGEPSAPQAWQEKIFSHGALAPVSYCPVGHKLLAQAGFPRPDGRKKEELRACHFRTSAVPNAAGSAYVEQGRTKIVAAVYGPRQAGEKAQAAAQGVLAVDLQFAPFCSKTASKDESERRSVLYNSVLQGALESVILLERYAKTMIDVHIMVLEDDGSALTVALTAASLALADATVDMRDLAAGASVYLRHDGTSPLVLLDCDGEEEQNMPEGSAVLHLGLCPSRGTLCLIHSAGPLQPGMFEKMVLLAKDTAEAVGAEMRYCLENRVERRAAKRLKLIGKSI